MQILHNTTCAVFAHIQNNTNCSKKNALLCTQFKNNAYICPVGAGTVIRTGGIYTTKALQYALFWLSKTWSFYSCQVQSNTVMPIGYVLSQLKGLPCTYSVGFGVARSRQEGQTKAKESGTG
jgi:hypothetical protein